MTEAKGPEYEPITWSEDNMVMFLDGYAWTTLVLNGDFDNICLGKADDVKAILSGAKPISDAQAPRQVEALARILELREETDGVHTRAGGLERKRPLRAFGNRSKNPRLSQVRKRLSRGKGHR